MIMMAALRNARKKDLELIYFCEWAAGSTNIELQ